MSEGTPIRVFLVEDQTLISEEMRSLLQSYPNIDLIGVAEDGEKAVAEVAKLQPTVVVMDVNLPKMDGIAATRMIKTAYPHIVVIGLTSAPEEYLLYAMLRAGAFEVLGKAKAVSDLYSIIQRAVAATQPILILQEDTITPSTTAIGEEPMSLPKTDVLPAGGNKENIDVDDKA